jgi:hypothetical protein
MVLIVSIVIDTNKFLLDSNPELESITIIPMDSIYQKDGKCSGIFYDSM